MMRRMVFPLLLGLGGAAVLAALGTWQVQRLEWKQAILADIAGRMEAAPVAIPDGATAQADNYRRVQVRGVLEGPEAHVLISRKPDGPGFRVIRALRSDAGPVILVDLGTVPEAAKTLDRPGGPVLVEGNLIWPDEVDGFTPAPDLGRNIWFARDLPALAAALETAPLMVVLSASDPALAPLPWPVGVNIPNDHLQYAITWFSLMAIWIGMTVYLLWRIRRGDETRG